MLEKLLRKKFPELNLSTNRRYSELTTFGVGSAPVPLLAEPETIEMLGKLLKFLHSKNIPVFILGAGTNVVGSDTPFEGVIVRASGSGFSNISVDGNTVKCGAYVKLPMLCNAVAKAGLSGLAPLSGIPGSIGGAIRMNAGANGVEIAKFVKHVSGFRPNGTVWQADGCDIEWLYRANSIPHDLFITEVILELASGSKEAEEKAIADEREKRRLREPAGHSAGCAFRNVSPAEPAGKLIDLCGLRGLRIGDLEVSPKHANYLINTGSASEKDYIDMVRILRRAVSEKYGFYLTNEIVPVNASTNADIEKDTPPPVVNVLYGGNSSERDISLQSGSCIAKSLRNAGFKVELSDIRECKVTPQMLESDVIYPVLHGGFGEDGRLQNELEKAELRFVGSGSVASALVMDKLATKRLLDAVKLPTAPWAMVSKTDRKFPEHLHFPVMLKAPCEGSTVGIIKVNSIDEWNDALEEEFKFSDELLVEEFITGVEISIPIINATVLDAVEIVSPSGFYDWDAKYVYANGTTEYFCPPKSLSADVVKVAQEYALKYYHAARCRDILRVDFIVTADGTPYILEGNNLPGNTEHSLVPMAAKQAGISLEKMTSTMVYAAMKRSGKPESGGGTGKSRITFNAAMISAARWLFRFSLLMSAWLLLKAAFAYGIDNPVSWPLATGGIFLVISETIFIWFKYLEKK
ncbi:MAG: UDP-N-acetylmuramate dehydrogenase [Lentisphaeria bacterium]|nr:UDP-N-acetylmuramate dehydrogenase [Lentisphaeria bacterium]